MSPHILYAAVHAALVAVLYQLAGPEPYGDPMWSLAVFINMAGFLWNLVNLPPRRSTARLRVGSPAGRGDSDDAPTHP